MARAWRGATDRVSLSPFIVFAGIGLRRTFTAAGAPPLHRRIAPQCHGTDGEMPTLPRRRPLSEKFPTQRREGTEGSHGTHGTCRRGKQ